MGHQLVSPPAGGSLAVVTRPWLGLLGAALCVAFVACSSEPESAAPSATSAAVTTSTSTTSTTVPEVTTIEVVAAAEFSSAGEVEIDGEVFSFSFECWAAGAGDVLALGVGERESTGEQTQAIVQAFLGDPYVAVLIGADDVLELAVDQRAELFIQEDSIRGSALRFVEAVTAGVGPARGLGSVQVQCDGFAPGLPDDYVVTPLENGLVEEAEATLES